jgi:hypothetical protein
MNTLYVHIVGFIIRNIYDMEWNKRRQNCRHIINFVESETVENMQQYESVTHSYVRTELCDITRRIVSERAWIKLPNMSSAVPINLPYIRVKLSKDHFSDFHAGVVRTAASGS